MLVSWGVGALFSLAMVLINMPYATASFFRLRNVCNANIHEKCGSEEFYMCKGNVEVCVLNTRSYRGDGYRCGRCARVFQQGNTFSATDGQTANLFPQGNAQTTPANVVCGAIQAVLGHPTNADICFAGATNGGVWRTTSCRASEPVWEPLTDFEDSLSVGDMVFDTEDATANTVVVAVGRRSSFNLAGGIGIGLLYSENALAPIPTWRVLDINAGGADSFRANDVQFRSLFVRGNLMLAAAFGANPFSCAYIGVFRSTDGGDSWTNVLRGVGLAIAADPNDLDRFYAAVDFTSVCNSSAVVNGVFTSNDMGATWTETSPIEPAIAEGNLTGAKLSVSADKSGVGSSSRVWSALVDFSLGSVVASIAYSDNHGVTWTTMDEVDDLTDAGYIHLSMLVSPNNTNEVYVGGGIQPGIFQFDNGTFTFVDSLVGAIGYTGRLFRGNASVQGVGQMPSLQWEHMTDSDAVPQIPEGGTAGSSGPHGDSRDMEFRADGSILEGSDGGITVRSSPDDNTGDWFGLCGNIQAFETHSIAYEPIRKMVLFGNQDTGTIAGVLGKSDTYRSMFLGDGNACMIDYTSDPDLLFFYYGSQEFSAFARQAYSRSTGVEQGDAVAFLTLPAIAGFVSAVAMNPANQKEFVVALADDNKSIAFTNNRGDTFSRTGVITLGTITSMAWSGGGNTLYIASFNGETSSISRCSGCCLSPPTCDAGVAVPGSAYVYRLAVDPQNNDVVFAVSAGGKFDFRFPKLFSSVDGGASWNDITVAGSLLNTASLGASVAVIAKNTVNAVAVGTSNGVLVPDGGVGVGWKLLAPGLPKVAVLQMLYEPLDDTLVVALFGRGVWFLRQASEVVSGTAGSFVGGAENGDGIGVQLVHMTGWNMVEP